MMKEKNGGFGMKEYNFEEDKEYGGYKGIGSSKEYKNYCTWENSIIEKYKEIDNIQFLINFKAYLNKMCSQNERRREAMVSLWIPFLTLIISFSLIIPSIFLGVRQYQDSFQSDINNKYLENMITNKSAYEKIVHQQVDFFTERLDQFKDTMNFIMVSMCVIYIIIVMGGVILGFALSFRVNRILFYRDYINVINKLIEEKSKINKRFPKKRATPSLIGTKMVIHNYSGVANK
ncbi:hypothetical protein [Lacrimispora sp. JR3]|uniref:hypothetical protein n=1 Tax=Lacrimispora sinapis TaxID=3111456 RepID=UPI00374846EC